MNALFEKLNEKIRKYTGSAWNPMDSLVKSRLLKTRPELEFAHVPLPQYIMTMSEMPFVVDYSDIEKVHIEFSWSTVYGDNSEPILITAENAEIRLRFMYPSEWDVAYWEEKFIRKEQRKTMYWDKYASVLAKSVANMSLRQSVGTKTINSLSVSIKNVHLQIVDDSIAGTPFAFETFVDEIRVSAPGPDDPRLTKTEQHGFQRHLFQCLWIRFLGFHFLYKEFANPMLPDRKATFEFLKSMRQRLETEPDKVSPAVKKLYLELLDFYPQLKNNPPQSEDFSPGLLEEVAREIDADQEFRDTIRKLPKLSVQPTHAAPLPSRRRGPPRFAVKKKRKKKVKIKQTEAILQFKARAKAANLFRSFIRSLQAKSPSSTDSPSSASETSTREAISRWKKAHDEKVRRLSSPVFRDASVHGEAPQEDDDGGEAEVANLRSRYRIFNSTQDPDLLKHNPHTFRLTPAEGMDLHILSKRWELRALSLYDLSQDSFKEIHIGFAKADPDKGERNVPPEFNRPETFPSLHLSFTAGAFGALFAFIKHLEMFGVFTKGAGAKHRQILTVNDARRYYSIMRERLSALDYRRQRKLDEQLSDIERKFLMADLMPIKELAARHHLSPESAEEDGTEAILGENRRRGTVINGSWCMPQRPATCCGNMSGIDMSDLLQGEGRAFREVFGPARTSQSNSELSTVESERLQQLQKVKWFLEETHMVIAMPNIAFELIPVARKGTLLQGVPLQPIGRPLPLGLQPHYPPAAVSLAHRASAPLWRFAEAKTSNTKGKGKQMLSHLGVVSSLTFRFSMAIMQEKWTVFRKATYVRLTDVVAFNKTVLMALARPEQTVNAVAMQTRWHPHLPQVVIVTQTVSEFPPQLAMCLPQNIESVTRALKQTINPAAKSIVKLFEEYSLAQSTVIKVLNSASPTFGIPSLTASDVPYVKCGIDPANQMKLTAPLFRRYILQALDPTQGMLVAQEDDALTSRKRLQILVPQLYFSLNVLFQFLNEFPPVIHLNRELFHNVDAPHTAEQITALNEGYSLSSVYRSTEVFVPSVCVSMFPKSQMTLFGVEVDAAIGVMGLSSYDSMKAAIPQAIGRLRSMGPTACSVALGIAGFRLSDDSDRTMIIGTDCLTISDQTTSTEQGTVVYKMDQVMIKRLMAMPLPTNKPVELCLINVGAIDVPSTEALVSLGLMWEDISQTVLASCSIRDLDYRLKQYNNPRNLKLAAINEEKDPHPEFIVRRSAMVRRLPHLSAVSNSLLRKLTPSISGDESVKLFINLSVGRISVWADAKGVVYFTLNILKPALALRQGTQGTLDVTSAVSEIFVAATTSHPLTQEIILRDVVLSKQIARVGASTAAVLQHNPDLDRFFVTPPPEDVASPRTKLSSAVESEFDLSKSARDHSRETRAKKSPKGEVVVLAIEPDFHEDNEDLAVGSTTVNSPNALYSSDSDLATSDGELIVDLNDTLKLTGDDPELPVKTDGGTARLSTSKLWAKVADSIESEVKEYAELYGASLIQMDTEKLMRQINSSTRQLSFSLVKKKESSGPTMVIDVAVRSLFLFTSPIMVGDMRQYVNYFMSFVSNQKGNVDFFLRTTGALAVETTHLGCVKDALHNPDLFAVAKPDFTITPRPAEKPSVVTTTIAVTAKLSNVYVSLVQSGFSVPQRASETAETAPTPMVIRHTTKIIKAVTGSDRKKEDSRRYVTCVGALNSSATEKLLPDDKSLETPLMLFNDAPDVFALIGTPVIRLLGTNSTSRAALVFGESLGCRVNTDLKLSLTITKRESAPTTHRAVIRMSHLELCLFRDLSSLLSALTLDTVCLATSINIDPKPETPKTTEAPKIQLVDTSGGKAVWSQALLESIKSELETAIAAEEASKMAKPSTEEPSSPAPTSSPVPSIDFFTLEVFNIILWAGSNISVGSKAASTSLTRLPLTERTCELWDTTKIGHNRDITLATLRGVPSPPPFASSASSVYKSGCLLVPVLQGTPDVIAWHGSHRRSDKRLAPWLNVSVWTRTCSGPDLRPRLSAMDAMVDLSGDEADLLSPGARSPRSVAPREIDELALLASVNIGGTWIVFEQQLLSIFEITLETMRACLESAVAAEALPTKTQADDAEAKTSSLKKGSAPPASALNVLQHISRLDTSASSVPLAILKAYQKALKHCRLVLDLRIPQIEFCILPHFYSQSRTIVSGATLTQQLKLRKHQLITDNLQLTRDIEHFHFALLESTASRGIASVTAPVLRLASVLTFSVLPGGEGAQWGNDLLSSLFEEPVGVVFGMVANTQENEWNTEVLRLIDLIVEAGTDATRLFQSVWMRCLPINPDRIWMNGGFSLLDLELGQWCLTERAQPEPKMMESADEEDNTAQFDQCAVPSVPTLADVNRSGLFLWSITPTADVRWQRIMRLRLFDVVGSVELLISQADPAAPQRSKMKVIVESITIDDHQQLPILHRKLAKANLDDKPLPVFHAGVVSTPKATRARVVCANLRIEIDPITLEKLSDALHGCHATFVMFAPGTSRPRYFGSLQEFIHDSRFEDLNSVMPIQSAFGVAHVPCRGSVEPPPAVSVMKKFSLKDLCQQTFQLSISEKVELPEGALSRTTTMTRRRASMDATPPVKTAKKKKKDTRRVECDIQLQALELWVYPWSADARRRRLVTESTTTAITHPYLSESHHVYLADMTFVESNLTRRSLDQQSSSEVAQTVKQSTIPASTVQDVAESEHSTDTGHADLNEFLPKSMCHDLSEEEFDIDEGCGCCRRATGQELSHSSNHLLEGMPMRLPSRSVVRSIVLEETRPYPLHQSRRAFMRRLHRPARALMSDNLEEAALMAPSTQELLYALYCSVGAKVSQQDENEVQGTSKIALFLAIGAPSLISAKSDIPSPSGLGVRRTYTSLSPILVGMSGTPLPASYFTAVEAGQASICDDIILSVSGADVSFHLVRCWELSAKRNSRLLRHVPSVFDSVRFPVMSADIHLMKEHLLCPVKVLSKGVRLNMSTAVLFEAKECANVLKRRVTRAMTKWRACSKAKNSTLQDSMAASDQNISLGRGSSLSPMSVHQRDKSMVEDNAVVSEEAVPQEKHQNDQVFFGQSVQGLSDLELQADAAALREARELSRVLINTKYELKSEMPQSASPRNQMSDEYEHTLVHRQSTKFLGRFFYDVLGSKRSDSILFHINFEIDNLELALLQREITAFKLWIPSMTMYGPLPLIGESRLSFEALARLYSWNPFSNKGEEIIDPLTIQLAVIRSLPLPQRFNLPTLDVSMSISPLHLLVSAGPLQSLNRVLRSAQIVHWDLKANLRKIEDEILIVNETGAPLGIAVLPEPTRTSPQAAYRRRFSGSSVMMTNKIPETPPDEGDEIEWEARGRLLSYGTMQQREFTVERDNANLHFCIMQQDLRSRKKSRTQRASVTEPVPDSDHRVIDVVADMDSMENDSQAGANQAIRKKVQTPDQLGQLWFDLVGLGEPGFLSVARILAEDPELREVVQRTGAIGEEKREVARAYIEKERPYRSQIMDSQNDFLLSTTRHVESILQSLIEDAPFLLRNKIDILSNVHLIDKLFKAAQGWINCGPLKLDVEGSRGYNVKNLGHRIVVEPQINTIPHLPNRALVVGTSVQLVNLTSLPILVVCRVRTNRLKNLAQRLVHLPIETLPRPIGQALMKLRDRTLFRRTESAMDMDEEHAPWSSRPNETGSPVGRASQSLNIRPAYRDPPTSILIEPSGRVSVPLSWFADPKGHQISISPLLCARGQSQQDDQPSTEKSFKQFRQLQSLLLHLEAQENITALDHARTAVESVLQKRLTKLLASTVTLQFRRGLALSSSIKVFDLATTSVTDLCPKYIIQLEPFLNIRNLLPFPITLKLIPKLQAEGGCCCRRSPAVTAREERRSGGPALAAPLATSKLRAGQLIESVTAVELERIRKNQPIYATIPTNWSWGVPFATPEMSVHITIHGLPVDSFDTGILSNKYAAVAWNKNLVIEQEQLRMISKQFLASLIRKSDKSQRKIEKLTHDLVKHLQTSGGADSYDHQSAGNVTSAASIQTGYHSELFINKDFGLTCRNSESDKIAAYTSRSAVGLWLYGADAMFQRVVTDLVSSEFTFPKLIQHSCSLMEQLQTEPRRMLHRAARAVQSRNHTTLQVAADPRKYFANFTVGFHSSRRHVSVFLPYMLENATSDSLLMINSKPLPPKCRLFLTEEELKNARISAIQQDPVTGQPCISSTSARLDFLSNPNNPRPAIILDMSHHVGHHRLINRKAEEPSLNFSSPRGGPTDQTGQTKLEEPERHQSATTYWRQKVNRMKHGNTPSDSFQTATHANKDSTALRLPRAVSLGMVVRFAETPFGDGRIISFVPYIQVYSRLPFVVCVSPTTLTTARKFTRSVENMLEPATLLRPNETRVLNTGRAHAVIFSPSATYATRPFPLQPTNVPSVMQLQLEDYSTPGSKNASLIIQVNVVSAQFKGAKSPAGYSMAGLWFILSLPTSPHFMVRNLTNHSILCAPGAKSEDRWLGDDTKHQLIKPLKPPPAAATLELGQPSPTFLAWLQRSEESRVTMLAPGDGLIHFAPPGEEDRASASIMVAQARRAKWHVQSLVSVKNDVTVIEYEPIQGPTALKTPDTRVTRTPATKRAGKTSPRKISPNELETLGSPQLPEVALEPPSDHKNQVFGLLTVNKEGTRILHLVEDKALVESIRRGDTKGRTKLITARGGVQMPFVRLRFDLTLERVRVTWSHGGKFVVAMHMSDFVISGYLRPRQQPTWICQVGAEPVEVLSDRPMDSDSGDEPRRLWSTNKKARPLSAVRERFRNRRKDKNDDFGTIDTMSVKMTQILTYATNDVARVFALKRLQSSRVEELMHSLLLNGLLVFDVSLGTIHCDHFVEGDVPVLVKSAPRGTSYRPVNRQSFGLFGNARGSTPDMFAEMTAAELFAEAEKLLETRLTPKTRTADNSAIFMSIVKHLLDPAHASVYDQIAINVSPLLVNVEIDVLEQLAALFEKEKSIISSPSMCPAVSRYQAATNFVKKQQREAANGEEELRLLSRAAQKVLKPPILHTVKDLRKLTESNFRGFQKSVYMAGDGSFSPVLVTSSPKWTELKDTHAVYFQKFGISPLEIAFSIRTSGKKINREILYVIDALPLDSPYLAVQVPEKRREFFVSTWAELAANLKHSYISSLIQRSLPLGWLYYPLAPLVGLWRGTKTLVEITREEVVHRKHTGPLTAAVVGLRLGVVIVVLNFCGGTFFVISHVCDFVHKLLGGYRPRPSGVIDGFAVGFKGFILDLVWRPWQALIVHTQHQLKRGDTLWKIFVWTLWRILRCCLAPLMASLNFVASVTEGFANALIGDFEHLSRIQESADLGPARMPP